ncbi:anti-sigma factor family protein [Archangium primigenium]|uniref:anti-sigma factor family protein n=1 Tax=[Archangium] primigenium TaxID=2792470 RepID=UPI00195991E7|nr:zf-HC2 domain-containing protein [Archangium primigenium]MBM7112203.1 zf-HC2 domain-containing protein [Archangium primigenium]
MNPPCRQEDLDALVARELSEADARRVSAHAEHCDTCRRALEWLRMERGWMARRARRPVPRRALDYGALEARLKPARPRPSLVFWEWRGLGLAAVTAALLGVVLHVGPSTRAPVHGGVSEAGESWSEGLMSMARVEVCLDPSLEAAARMEAQVGACLMASPTRPPR